MIIERLVMGEHAVDSMQQFTHDSAHCLQRCFAVFDQMLKKALHVWVMFPGGQGRQIEGMADIAVAGFGNAGALVHAGSRLEVAGVQSCRLDPLLVGQPRGQ